jgi:hypothetical protein
MPIAPDQPIVIPPTPEQDFPLQWVFNLRVIDSTSSSGGVYIELLPYNPTTQELGPWNLVEIVQTDKLWQAASEVPEVAAAMQAVIDCVGPLRAWIKTQAEPVTEE